MKGNEMKERLRQRLEDLQAEYEKGRKTLEDLESQAGRVRAAMLRISGAIQVLKEELTHDGEEEAVNGEVFARPETHSSL